MLIFGRVLRRSRHNRNLFPWWITDWKSWLAGLGMIAAMTFVLIALPIIFQTSCADDFRARVRDSLWTDGR